MTHRTITIPPVTAALLAYGVTPWSTHDFRGSVQPGDRGIIVAGAGPVRSDDVPEGWFYDDEHSNPPLLSGRAESWHSLRVVPRAAVSVGTVAEVVPIVEDAAAEDGGCIDASDMAHWPDPFDLRSEAFENLSHLLPFADWSPTTASGKQRWAVRWEDMRIIEPAVTKLPCRCTNRPCPFAEWVPLHRGWRVADPGLVAAVGEASDGA